MISLRFIEYYEILGNGQNTWNYGKTNIYIYIYIVGAFLAPSEGCPLIAFGLFLLSHIKEFFLPVLPPLSSAQTYKPEGGGRILQCGTVKKAKRLQGTSLAWS